MANKVIAIGGIALFIVLLLGISLVGYYVIGTNTQSIIPNSCVIQNNDFKFNTFSCPSTATICEATVNLNCQTQTNSPKVIFRTENLNLEATGNKISWDVDGDGNLECFVKSTSNPSPTANIPYINEIRLPSRMGDIKLYGDNSQVFAVKDDSKVERSGVGNYLVDANVRYFAGTGCNVIESSIDLNREIVEGNVNSYTCSQDITDLQGRKLKTLSYSGQVPGTSSETLIVEKNQGINWNGKIDYVISNAVESECTSDVQGNSPDSYYQCLINTNGCGVISAEESFCPAGTVFKESDGSCGVPYTVTITTTKNIYGVSQQISGQVELTDTNKKDFIPITITLRDILGNLKDFTTTSTNSRGVASFTLPGQTTTGDYKIVVEADHPDGSIPSEKSIVIAQPINLRLSAFPDKIQYSSEAITAKAFVTDNGGNPVDASSWSFSGTKCGNTDLSNDVQPIRLGRTDFGTEYLLSVPVSGSCQMVFKAVAIDNSGFRSEADAVSIEVREAEILIKLNLDSVQDADAGRHTVSFKTLDPNLQPIETTNQITITDSDGCDSGTYCIVDDKTLPGVVVTGKDGDYSFTYNYKDGLSTIKIRSSAPNIQSTTQESIVNLFPSGSQDPIGGGDSTSSGISTGTIITIIVAIFGVGLFFFIILRRRK